jgi:ribonucleoside-diphosphate reductase alpha chain
MKSQGVKFFPEVDQGPDSVETKRKELVAKGRTEKEVKKLVPDWDASQVRTWVCEFPVAAPKGSITRHNITAIQQLEWYLKVMKNWCEHNQSITVYVKQDEWVNVGAWVYDHFDDIVGVSFLPYEDGHYKLAPYEEISKEKYEDLAAKMPKLDWSKLPDFEKDDQTVVAQTLACSGNTCDLG